MIPMDEFKNQFENENENYNGPQEQADGQPQEQQAVNQGVEPDASNNSDQSSGPDNNYGADNIYGADSFEPANGFEQKANTAGDNFAGNGFNNYEPLNNPYPPAYNPIKYTDVLPVKDYEPASRGLKIFALIMAVIVLMTGTCITGYFLGKNSVVSAGSKTKVSLAAKPADTDESTAAEVYDMVDASIVGIYVYNLAGKVSQASGVFYTKDGYIVTNDHIYSEIPSPLFKVYTSDGEEHDAKYIAGDVISDLAVLKIEGNNYKAATFGDPNEVVCGENVVAIGRPTGAFNDSSITKGIVSVVNRRVQTTSNYSARMIQTDSAINPGSSGGALVNMYGQVIGITSSKLAGVEYDSVGYAIPTTTMKRIVDELIANGKVISRAKLGITYTAIDSVTAAIKGYDHLGLYIASVSDDSDLYGKAAEGDIITHINGVEIKHDYIVLDIIEESRAGDKITLTIQSSKGVKEYTVTLKANVGMSSYSAQAPSGSDSSGKSNGGAFDFPFGE